MSTTTLTASSATPPPPQALKAGAIAWTPVVVVQTLALFAFAGLAEIGGGWLVWQTIREKKPWYYALSGCVVLCAYGFIPTLQPEQATFARVYAVYGGVFIVMSYGWGWALDSQRPDLGDWVGSAIALAGVMLCWFWPRRAAVALGAGEGGAGGGVPAGGVQ